MKPLFIVSKTYDVVTQESASRGDYAESGYVYEKQAMTLKELLDELDSIHFFENFDPRDEQGQSLYASDPEFDCVTGEVTSEAVHIRANSRLMRRLNKILAGRYFNKKSA